MKIMLTHSYKGGSGKTLFSINVANSLVTEFGKRTLLIEADFSMAAFQAIFPENKPDLFLNDFLNSSDNNLENYIYPDTKSDFGIIYCDTNFKAKDQVHGSDQNFFLEKRKQLKVALKKLDYDYVIFDVTPGLHFFAINAISLCDHIFLMARPDIQNLNGLDLLLQKVFTKTVSLSRNSLKLYLIFNQLPKVDEMKGLLDRWSADLYTKYPFLQSIEGFYYEPETSYFTATSQFILPKDDPTRREITNFIKRNLMKT
ncbi:MAG: ParA family protein [Candidatus Heimdallarchaeota archaeon]|nr:ParA family protein [Candidatus Heimdallarchaeota archaeon]